MNHEGLTVEGKISDAAILDRWISAGFGIDLKTWHTGNADDQRSLRACVSGFPGQAPAADGMGQFYGGDHNFPSK